MSVIANDFIDFIYCGHSLSEYSGIIGDINGGGSVDPLDIGSVLNLNPVELKSLKKRKSVVATYDDYVEKQFSFFKNPCSGLSYYTREEVAQIIRWLNQPRYEKFTPIYSDVTWPSVHYYASFNIQPIVYIGNVIGFKLNMTTNAPFGYYDEVTVSGTELVVINDASDEQGFIYPSCTITMHDDGNLVLINSVEPSVRTTIANCVSGEVININGEKGTITSSVPHVNLHDDFNYVFPKIINKMTSSGTDNIQNEFRVNIRDTEISMTYEPISKFGLI